MKSIQYTLILFTIFTLSSCATWRTGEVDSEYSFDNHEENGSKLHASIKLVSYDYIENEKENKKWVTKKKFDRVFGVISNSFKETGLFNIIDDKNLKGKDHFKIEVTVRRNITFSENMKWVTPLSLYLIPRSVSENLVITTKFLNNKGSLIGMTEFNDNLVTWHQLFMILGLPFTGTANNQVMNSVEELVKSSIEQALEDGYFNSFESL